MKGVTGRRAREAGNGLITNDKVVTNFKEGAYFFLIRGLLLSTSRVLGSVNLKKITD